MRIKTTTVARWNTQSAGKAKRDLINAARDLIAKGNAPRTIEVPFDIWCRHMGPHVAREMNRAGLGGRYLTAGDIGFDCNGRAFVYARALPELGDL